MDNKYCKECDALSCFCPFTVTQMCGGEKCMAWKWTAYKHKTKTVAVKSADDNLYHKYHAKTKINTHGCCGLVYTGEIESNET